MPSRINSNLIKNLNVIMYNNKLIVKSLSFDIAFLIIFSPFGGTFSPNTLLRWVLSLYELSPSRCDVYSKLITPLVIWKCYLWCHQITLIILYFWICWIVMDWRLFKRDCLLIRITMTTFCVLLLVGHCSFLIDMIIFVYNNFIIFVFGLFEYLFFILIFKF